MAGLRGLLRSGFVGACLVAAACIGGNGGAQTLNRPAELQAILNRQRPIPELSADQWVWSGDGSTEYDDAYQFGDKVWVMLTNRQNTKTVIWDPDTGIGSPLTAAEAQDFFDRFKWKRVETWKSPQRLSDGLVVRNGPAPGETFHCHPVLSGSYTAGKNGQSADYSFVSRIEHPKSIDYKVCSEGELPDHEVATMHLEAVGLTLIPIERGYTLAFPTGVAGFPNCFIKLDAEFHQRGYKPGCPVQLDATAIDLLFSEPGNGSPSYRERVVAPLFDSAVERLTKNAN